MFRKGAFDRFEQVVAATVHVITKRDSCPEQLLCDRAYAVTGKRRAAEHRVLTAGRHHTADQVDQLVRAIAETQLLGRDAVMHRQRLAQVVSAGIRVTVQLK